MRQAGLVVLAVNERDTATDVRAFINRFGHSSEIMLDSDGAVARAYSVTEIPTTVIVGRDGNILYIASGSTPYSARQLDDAVARALHGTSDR